MSGSSWWDNVKAERIASGLLVEAVQPVQLKQQETQPMKSAALGLVASLASALHLQGTQTGRLTGHKPSFMQQLLNWCSPPADTGDFGRMSWSYGRSGRYGRKHSTCNKVGSHKQTMRKLGKL